ncbi:hypothetical protein KQ882_15395, partial [Listeria monocytogenes]|nr:hypothetical protein [Listeria monocytogenes]
MTISFRYRFARPGRVRARNNGTKRRVRAKAKRYLFFHRGNAGADDFSTNPASGEVPEFRPGADPQSTKWYQPNA